MTEEQAITIADAFVREQLGSDPRALGDRLSYALLGARQGENQEWRVVCQWVLPDHPGSVIDGPAIVIVDPMTREARFR
jgi:hypothetical protein